MTLSELVKITSDKKKCRRLMAYLRWPDGFRCDYCGASGPLLSKPQCSECGTYSTLNGQGIMRHSSYRLDEWILGAYLTMLNPGISSRKLAYMIGCHEKHAYRLLDKLHQVIAKESWPGTLFNHEKDIEVKLNQSGYWANVRKNEFNPDAWKRRQASNLAKMIEG